MKPRLFLWILRRAQYAALSLVAVLAASACGSAESTVPAALPTVESIPATAAPVDPTSAPPATLAPTQTVSVQVAPTSRGPNLEATDPTTVVLASGQLQLVEFFRFTWGTCRSMAPMVHGLEAEYYGKVKFSYLDADDPRTDIFQQTLGFYYQPEFYFLNGDGGLIAKLVGPVSEDEFRNLFDTNLQ